MNAIHGGNLRALAAACGRSPDDVLDFSANINPLGAPRSVADELRAIARFPASLAAYPDPVYADVRDALAHRHGTHRDRIVVGNGGAALIGAIVRALRPERCVLPVPAFSEYRKALAEANVDVRTVPLAAETYELDVDAIVRVARRTGATICIAANPNNPTGALTSRGSVGVLARELANVGCTLLIDEAFVDYVPEASCIDDELPAIVLRSLTKFFAIPGARVGYAVASPDIARTVTAALPSWPIGTIDARIALAVMENAAYEKRTRDENRVERTRLHDALETLGLTVHPSSANFLFVDVAPLARTARQFAARLLERDGIAVRTCDDYEGLRQPTFVRIAVRSRRDDDRLLAAIEAAISEPTEKRTSSTLDDEEPS